MACWWEHRVAFHAGGGAPAPRPHVFVKRAGRRGTNSCEGPRLTGALPRPGRRDDAARSVNKSAKAPGPAASALRVEPCWIGAEAPPAGGVDCAWNGMLLGESRPPRRLARRAPHRVAKGEFMRHHSLLNRVVSRFYKYPYSEQRLAPLELLEIRLRVRPEIRRQLVQQRIEGRVRQ